MQPSASVIHILSGRFSGISYIVLEAGMTFLITEALGLTSVGSNTILLLGNGSVKLVRYVKDINHA
jgi:hypothetical protein